MIRCFILCLAVASLTGEVGAQTCGTDVELMELDAGAAGPVLRAITGAPVVGAPFKLRLLGAPQTSAGFFYLSPNESAVALPPYGATFFPGTPLIALPITTSATGIVTLANLASLPPSLCGVPAVLQAAVLDGDGQLDIDGDGIRDLGYEKSGDVTFLLNMLGE